MRIEIEEAGDARAQPRLDVVEERRRRAVADEHAEAGAAAGGVHLAGFEPAHQAAEDVLALEAPEVIDDLDGDAHAVGAAAIDGRVLGAERDLGLAIVGEARLAHLVDGRVVERVHDELVRQLAEHLADALGRAELAGEGHRLVHGVIAPFGVGEREREPARAPRQVCVERRGFAQTACGARCAGGRLRAAARRMTGGP